MSASGSKRLLCAAAVVLTVVSLSGAAVWQLHPRRAPSALQSTHISHHELKKFAKATIDVKRVTRKATVSWRAARSLRDMQAVAYKARQREMQALRAHGMTVRKYKAIAKAARADPRTRAEIMAYIEEYSNRRIE